ncbi:GH25 family lysozyme [Lactococcus lactis]|uniref:GH25 family lysozyme n=2 Tax=Lactococcus lactis TaxID=1358 RepID=UPI00240EB712|nr:GH25 family lysozyme [Lactococcus lactis]
MKLKKSYIISLMLFSGLLFAKSVLAEDAISSDNTPMGHYIEQEQSQEASKENTSDSSTTTPSIRARSFAAVPAANVPSDLKSDDNTLPRKDAVDIASYQSWMTQADFNSLKASGVQSIVVKLTEGTNYTNPYAANQIKMAQNAGLNVAVYHYARLTGANSQSTANSLAIQEAAYFAKVAKSFGLASNTVMIMDCEQPYRDGSGNIIGPNPVTVDWATAGVQFANSLKGNGYSNTKFYTSASWIGTNTATCQMNYNTLGGPKNLWAAQYLYGKPSSSNLQNTQYGAWQYTSQMYYQGTSNLKANAVDTSIDYSNFFNAKPDSYITKGADGNYYGYSSTGNKLFGQQKIKGNWYLFNRNTGAMLYGQQKDINNQWYLFNRSSGIMMYGQQKDINNQWYLFNRSTGIMMYGQQKDINNQWYLFNRSTGIMMHGLQKDINEQTYYFSNNSGTMQYGWQIIDNINYYFQPSTGILINT